MGKKHGKRYRSDSEKAPSGPVSVGEAVDALKQFGGTKFDQTVELAVWLGIDPKQADQAIRGATSLPNGIGKTRKVIAFCSDDDAGAARDAGAIEAGGDDLVAKVQKGWLDFDVTIATPPMMRKVGRLGRLLGPRGLMPSPKAGTIVKAENLPETIEEIRKGRVEFRVDRTGNLHIPFGRTNFTEEQLLINLASVMETVLKAKPPGQKGIYIRRMILTSTMSPGIKLDVTAAMGLPEIL